MKNLITTSKIIAVLSFAIATILFALQLYISAYTDLLFYGLIYTIVALIINIILIIILSFKMIGNSHYQEEILKTIGIIILNLPVALIYAFIILSGI